MAQSSSFFGESGIRPDRKNSAEEMASTITYTRLPPSRLCCLDAANIEVIIPGATARAHEARVCPMPLIEPKFRLLGAEAAMSILMLAKVLAHFRQLYSPID